ncbi:cyclin E-interacting protein minus [Cochliomyia hominivorax]
MTTLKPNFPINNNYESDTSSGGGSQIGIQIHHFDTPPSYDNEVIVTTSYSATKNMASTKSLSLHSLNELNNNNNNNKLENITQKETLKSQQRELMFGIPINSSQESSFEGFGSSPFNKLQRLFYSNQAQEQTSKENTLNVNRHQPPAQKASPGKMLFSKFYDTIVEENSCNAVDLQMSKDSGNCSLTTRRTSLESHNSSSSDMNPSSELSFNGKIKNFNSHQDSQQQSIVGPAIASRRVSNLMETSLNTSQQFSESFILKKYSNEKSPDLFGDDDDDDDVDDQDEDAENHEEDEDEHTQNLKTIPEHTTVLNESQTALSTCNLADNSFNCHTESSFANDDHTMDCSLTQGSCFGTSATSSDSYTLFKDNCRREREMLRRIRKCLAGILPPPSVTIPQLDMVSAVLSKKNDIFNFINEINEESAKQNAESANCPTTSTSVRPPSLFRPTHSLEETKNMPWRDILSVRQHGLCYNINKASENNEYLSMSVVERFIGAETASSYQNSPSSAKKRSTRLKLLCQSPGNRLSHLAKRRAIFSSANLATQKTSTLVGPQIMLDKKKVKNRRKATPKRMTPGSKKKNRKTPSSSARKRLFRNDVIKPGPSRETSKRALFQSPAKHVQQRSNVPKPPAMKPELANRVEKSKRALLFTPEKQKNEQKSITSYFAPSTSSSTQLDVLLKRKRCDDNDDVDTSELTLQSSKLFKSSSSTALTPRALKIKSQSFCIGAGSSTKHSKQLPCASTTFNTGSNMSLCSNNSSSSSSTHLPRTNSVASLLGSKLQKAYSDNVAPSSSLTENQKKKLLWAVSQALQEKKITAKHESFKQYASILARVVRRIFQEFYQKSSTSNSETMLRLAKKYVYPVTTGGSADDIYLQAKTQIEDTKRQSTTRLSGYIGPEEYQQLKLQSSQTQSHKGSTHNIFTTDNSFDSFGLISQTSSGFCGSTNGMSVSQTSFLGQISQDIIAADTSNSRSATKTIQTNLSLQNSSSKSNLCGVVLRENVDCELRRSAQKNFTGKDQRNMSPYAGGPSNGGSAVKAHSQLINDIAANSAKARRQISFDS